ncbi:MAG: hypothetical protein QM737_16110 [Ferruginibacter sp.]
MKKIFISVMLLVGITEAELCLAQNNFDPVFDIPESYLKRRFTIGLDRGNQVQVSVTDMADLAYISNVDSIIQIFSDDLARIKDSSLPAGWYKNIDYNMDDPAAKKMRIRKMQPAGNYFAFVNGRAAILKMHQDTIVISGKLLARSRGRRARFTERHYFRICFYLNDIRDLAGYRDGRLNEKIGIIRQYYKDRWQLREDDQVQLKKYPEITSATARGYVFQPKTFWFRRSVEIQNYKDRFVPSVSCTPLFMKEEDYVKREFGLSVEAAFGFEKMADGSRKTRINVFTGLEYNAIPLTSVPHRVRFYPSIIISYLAGRKGNLYDKNTFRIGLGNFSLAGVATRIQPSVYFNNLLKNITPSLRIIQRF